MLAVITYLSIIILSLVTLTSSLYGVGKNDNTNLAEYKISISFFVISLISTVGIFTYLHQGNLISLECRNSLFEIKSAPVV